MSSDEEDDEGEKRNPVGLVSVSLGRRVARTFSLPSRSVLSHLFCCWQWADKRNVVSKRGKSDPALLESALYGQRVERNMNRRACATALLSTAQQQYLSWPPSWG